MSKLKVPMWDDMWEVFKKDLVNKINVYIPKIKNFSHWKKESWSRPLDPHLCKLTTKKGLCGRDT